MYIKTGMAFKFVKFFDLPSIECNIYETNKAFKNLNNSGSFCLFDFLKDLSHDANEAVERMKDEIVLTYETPVQISYNNGSLYPNVPSTEITLNQLFLAQLLYSESGPVLLPCDSNLSDEELFKLSAQLNAFVIYVSLLKGARSCRYRDASNICNMQEMLLAWYAGNMYPEEPCKVANVARRTMCNINRIAFPNKGIIGEGDILINHHTSSSVSSGFLSSMNPRKVSKWCGNKKYYFYGAGKYFPPGLYRVKPNCKHNVANWNANDCYNAFEVNVSQGLFVKLEREKDCARD